MENLLRRKVDTYLKDWKNNPDRKPLIIKGARQIGKTRSIEYFANQNYKHVIQINFVEQKKYRDIFNDGFEWKQSSETSRCLTRDLSSFLARRSSFLMSCKHALTVQPQ